MCGGVNLLVKNFNNFAFEPVLNTTNFEYCNGKRNKIGQTVLVHVRAMDDDVWLRNWVCALGLVVTHAATSPRVTASHSNSAVKLGRVPAVLW